MEIYVWILIVFAAVDTYLIRHVLKRRSTDQALLAPSPSVAHDVDLKDTSSKGSTPDEAARFRKVYFVIYALVTASDWLQGPYIYAIYNDLHALPKATIAALFATGFIAAGVSASFAGHLADRYGRRLACLVFCAVTTGSCMSVVYRHGSLPMLFVGRILGGLGTTLLYSVFDTWMVATHNAKRLDSVLPLSDMFSHSVLLSGLVALCSGVVGELVVAVTTSIAAPFWLAVVCLWLASIGIAMHWDENYGVPSPATHAAPLPTDRHKIYVLALITTIFEGSMYMFVFNWTPALASARSGSGSSSTTSAMPLGLVFSCFMCAMMLGSQIFSIQATKHNSAAETSLLMVNILGVASLALVVPAVLRHEWTTFAGFQMFEAVVGIYYPLMNKFKSEVVGDETRGRVYAWMRLPLNVFVVAALTITRDGGDELRSHMFMSLGGLLLVAALVAKRYLA